MINNAAAISYTVLDQHNNELFFAIYTYKELYQACYSLNSILTQHPEYKWQKPNYQGISQECIIVQGDNNQRLVIRSSELSQILEYEPTAKEQTYVPPFPQSSQLYKLVHFDNRKTIPIEEDQPEFPKTKPKRPSRAKRNRKRKAPTDGQVTVAQLADEYDISSGKARNLLRKASFTKPKQGWTFSHDDPDLQKVREILQNG